MAVGWICAIEARDGSAGNTARHRFSGDHQPGRSFRSTFGVSDFAGFRTRLRFSTVNLQSRLFRVVLAESAVHIFLQAAPAKQAIAGCERAKAAPRAGVPPHVEHSVKGQPVLKFAGCEL